MTRITGQILVLAGDEPGLSALELALLGLGTNVFRAEAASAAAVLEKGDFDLVLVEPALATGTVRTAIETAIPAPLVVALVRSDAPGELREAMALGARDFLVAPITGDGSQDATRLLELATERARRGDHRKIREAETAHRLKEQVRELTERYVRQCRTFDEAQDVFYLDLSRMMTIFDNIMDGIVFTDPEGQVTLMNPVAEDLLGVKTIFAIGKCVRDLGRGIELIDEIAKDHERALIDGGANERTLEVHDAARDLAYLKLRTTAVTDYKGSFAGILTVIKDVTVEFKTEQMKNQYLSIVSHELRTPLTGIKTFATMMDKGTLGALPATQQTVMTSIREQVLRLEHEVDKLICLGRLELGDFALDREPLPVFEVLENATAPFKQLASDRDLVFELCLEGASPCVLADREDLRRAIQALVENAIKFTPDGGSIEVFVEELERSLKIHVKDDGPGINPRYHGRIFDKFFQVEDPLTRHHGGAGLGLNVAQGVAKAHNGRIEVVSELGRGADFRLCLPKYDKDRVEIGESGQGVAATIRKEH